MKIVASIVLAITLTTAALLTGARTTDAATTPGDVNGDCTVNSMDLLAVASRFGESYGSLRFAAVYDLNGDRRISAADIQMVAVQFGTSC